MASQDEKLLIVAFPSVGLVGAFATSYLVSQLQMKDVGELEIAEISPSYVIKNGEIFGPNRIYNKDNVYAILAGFPLNIVSAYDFVKNSIKFAKDNGIEKIIIPRGLEVGDNYKHGPTSYGLAITSDSKPFLEKYNLPIIPHATILGTDAGAISALKDSDVPCIVLYTTCRMMLPDDDAIIKSIKTMAEIINVQIETEKFEERLEKISKENQKMIEDTKKYFEQTSGKPASMPTPGVA
ncbi:PAC2 family protein [Nitrosopumilus sp. K4]|uniref:PAC2 family protein n=1 Tax=Nitrosopumilus sp. K4 TaxID=2795383 RepID=UPI001BA55F2D|nr:PAC2 family protein [Nitrosopumilus sp. K4]